MFLGYNATLSLTTGKTADFRQTLKLDFASHISLLYKSNNYFVISLNYKRFSVLYIGLSV